MRTGISTYRDGRLLKVPALHKDNRQISIEFSIQLLKDPKGQVEWVVAFVRDVTERYAREKALRAELSALLQAKTSGPTPSGLQIPGFRPFPNSIHFGLPDPREYVFPG